MASKRREAYERGIEEEAERQGAMAERTRNRMNELMTLGYEHAMEWLETAQPSDLRPQDVIQIAKLHLEAVKAFDVVEVPKEENWTEEDDQDLIERIARNRRTRMLRKGLRRTRSFGRKRRRTTDTLKLPPLPFRSMG